MGVDLFLHFVSSVAMGRSETMMLVQSVLVLIFTYQVIYIILILYEVHLVKEVFKYVGTYSDISSPHPHNMDI